MLLAVYFTAKKKATAVEAFRYLPPLFNSRFSRNWLSLYSRSVYLGICCTYIQRIGAAIWTQLKGHVRQLSEQKFASNVVEKVRQDAESFLFNSVVLRGANRGHWVSVHLKPKFHLRSIISLYFLNA